MAQRNVGTQTTKVAVSPNMGWIVTFAGVGINLALGILYSWSVISKNIPATWGWSEADKSWPYSVALLVFAFAMIPAGRLQDTIGPRMVATIGGVLVGVGMIVASLTTSPIGFIIGFGILAGAGIGFAYASATPPAVKWFNKHKTGMIAGLVVSGFGLASVYAAPSTQWLASTFDLPTTMRVFGIAFLVVVVVLSQLLKTPPAGYVPPEDASSAKNVQSGPAKAIAADRDFASSEMLSSVHFYMLWFIYFCGAGAGLMIVGKMAMIASDILRFDLGFMLVAVLAIGNGAGRIVAGSLSDKLGRNNTMIIFFALQTLMILLLAFTRDSLLTNVLVLGVVSAIIGACYGSNLALFPSISKDLWGLKNFGANYGFLFTAWGVGGFVMSMVIGQVYDANQSFDIAYYVAAALLIIGILLTLVIRSSKNA